MIVGRKVDETMQDSLIINALKQGLSNRLSDVRFLAPTLAMTTIKALYRTDEDHTLPGGHKVFKENTDYDMVHVILAKKNNDWKIVSIQLTSINAQAAAHNPVQASRWFF